MWDKKKLLKMLGIILAIFAVVIIFTVYQKKSSMTLSEYAAQYPEKAYATESSAE